MKVPVNQDAASGISKPPSGLMSQISREINNLALIHHQ
jgi:hypothetical protein